MRLAVAEEVPSQFPAVQAVGERHVPRLGTPPQPGMARRQGGWRGQERRKHGPALDRDREPAYHPIGHPDRRPGHDRQLQAVPGAHLDMPGSGGRGQPDPRRGRVRAQLWHILAGGSMSTAVTSTPAACSSRAAVSSRTPAITASPAGRSSSHHSYLETRSHSGTARRPVSSASTMRCRPFTTLPSGTPPGQRTMRTIVTMVLQKTARQRLGATLISVRRPATGYPHAGRSGNRQRRSRSRARGRPG